MDEFQFCRVCLVTDVKMFSLETKSSDSIGVFYANLAQVQICDSNQHVCFECASLLYKYQEFKSKCLRAHNILSRIRLDSSQLSRKTLKNVDRKEKKLESTLKVTPVVVVYEEKTNTRKSEFNNIENKENEESENDFEKYIVIENYTHINIDNEYDYYEDYNDCMEELDPETVAQPAQKSNHNKEPRHKNSILTINKGGGDFNVSGCTEEYVLETVAQPKNKIKQLKQAKTNKSTVIKNEGKDDSKFIEYMEEYVPETAAQPKFERKQPKSKRRTKRENRNDSKFGDCTEESVPKIIRLLKQKGKQSKQSRITTRKVKEYGDYECDICHIRFPQKGNLCKHRLSCHQRKFSCKLCPFVCYQTERAKSHVSLHKGLRYICKHCGEEFSVSNSLQMHYRLKHLDESVNESVCQFCGDVFGTPKGLHLHSVQLHRLDKNAKLGPECVDCDVHFTSELAWKRHLVLSAKHKVSNGCKFCGDIFSNEDDLKVHLKVHSRYTNRYNNIKLPAACAMCDVWLQSREQYKAHVTSAHAHSDEADKLLAADATPYVCEVCGQMFKKRLNLKYHQRRHTGERPYKCLECNKTFRMGGALTRHSQMHSGTKHKCKICARTFTFKGVLTKHMKVHLNIRPHKCLLCGKGFINPCDVKWHTKYVHEKVPWPKKKKPVIEDED